jgi:hypothetical protein
VGLLAGFLLSPKLWLSARFYPSTPVLSFLKPLSFPFDYVVFLGMLLCLCVAGLLGKRFETNRRIPDICRIVGHAESVALAAVVLSILVHVGCVGVGVKKPSGRRAAAGRSQYLSDHRRQRLLLEWTPESEHWFCERRISMADGAIFKVLSMDRAIRRDCARR